MKGHFGNYFIIERLGGGGMADVFLARTKNIHGITKPVAIKMIKSSRLNKAEDISLFRNEAQTAIQLQHGNVAQIYEFGSMQNRFYIAMELVQGINLATVQERFLGVGKNLRWPEIIWIIQQVAEGLRYVHELNYAGTQESLGIIHRDISPQNIMVTFEGEIKIVDFGVSRSALSSKGIQDLTAGKMRYMSPEQLQGKEIDARTDLYALGVTLWELAARYQAFDGMSEDQMMKAILSDGLPNILEYSADCPDYLARFIKKACHPDPDQRFQSAREMSQTLSTTLSAHFPDFSNQNLRDKMQTFFAMEKEALESRISLSNADVLYHQQDEQRGIKITPDDPKKTVSLVRIFLLFLVAVGIFHLTKNPHLAKYWYDKAESFVLNFSGRSVYREIQLITKPDKAHVHVDSQYQGTTPIIIKIPDVASYVTIQKKGYKIKYLDAQKTYGRVSFQLEKK